MRFLRKWPLGLIWGICLAASLGALLHGLFDTGVMAKLRRPEIYEPVARRLAIYCQSDLGLFPRYLSYAWFPEGLARLGDGTCSIGAERGQLEMGGGFNHFGYIIELDHSASTAATNVWQLALYREGSENVPLTAVAVGSTQRFCAQELYQLAESGFGDRLRRGEPEAYKGKVMLELRFGKLAEAAQTCKDWMERALNSWLPRFTRAHVRCRQGEVESASDELAGWVKAHAYFKNWIYLALFEFREGRTNRSLEAVHSALDQPFVEAPASDPVADVNKFALGYNGAIISYAVGDYGLCLATCAKMLPDSSLDKWWRRKVLRLKAAATFLTGDQPQALALLQEATSNLEHDPFSEEAMIRADKSLYNAILEKDLGFVKSYRNCVDERDSWFNPFETDETGIHGRALNNPTPYPDSWKGDGMSSEAQH